MEMQIPVVIALSMTDVATSSSIDISIEVLQRHLGGVPIVPVVAKTGRGLDNLKEVLEHIAEAPATAVPESWPELSSTADELAAAVDHSIPRIDVIGRNREVAWRDLVERLKSIRVDKVEVR